MISRPIVIEGVTDTPQKMEDGNVLRSALEVLAFTPSTSCKVILEDARVY